MRGGQPGRSLLRPELTPSSPRAWRSTHLALGDDLQDLVFSTCVEVNHGLPQSSHIGRRLLHVRGGQPCAKSHSGIPPQSSPRAWRSTSHQRAGPSSPVVFSTCVEVNRQPMRRTSSSLVFSTCVEVNRPAAVPARRFRGLLHVRGGQPDPDSYREFVAESSPRAWRSIRTFSAEDATLDRTPQKP